ncbi:MAG: N-acetyl-gamma-glutamyl-phosphate reductase [Bacteroidales bacterium]|nr:N-acetyl-gamma-glutamyl-phosphate reductase [Bacteroidales bacterium]
MVRVGIIGGAGYTAGELIRLLLLHPEAEIVFVQSESSAGKLLSEVHEGIWGDTDLRFTDNPDLGSVDVLFLCRAHGASRAFWEAFPRPASLKVIDLAQDFRDGSCGYVYGLPELNADRIRQAVSVANPGCFATAIQLALLPLASAGLLAGPVEVTAVTGSTGAGAKPGATTHFSWRSGNISAYKIFAHQHLAEICRNLAALQGGPEPEIRFVPLRGDFARGIFAVLHTQCGLWEAEARKLYEDYYSGAPFTNVAAGAVDLKQVTGTNKCLLQIEKHDSRLVVCSAIDNLLKGASGQAVENMNLMCGLPQTAGLRLKATAF